MQCGYAPGAVLLRTRKFAVVQCPPRNPHLALDVFDYFSEKEICRHPHHNVGARRHRPPRALHPVHRDRRRPRRDAGAWLDAEQPVAGHGRHEQRCEELQGCCDHYPIHWLQVRLGACHIMQCCNMCRTVRASRCHCEVASWLQARTAMRSASLLVRCFVPAGVLQCAATRSATRAALCTAARRSVCARRANASTHVCAAPAAVSCVCCLCCLLPMLFAWSCARQTLCTMLLTQLNILDLLIKTA